MIFFLKLLIKIVRSNLLQTGEAITVPLLPYLKGKVGLYLCHKLVCRDIDQHSLSMVSNLGCQVDCIWKQLRDKVLNKYVRNFLDQVI